VANQFAALDFREDPADLVGMAWRNEQAHAPADDLIRRVAVHQLRAPVPGLNVAVQILREDGVVRGFDERGQHARRFVR
jgi:hypothetical protein